MQAPFIILQPALADRNFHYLPSVSVSFWPLRLQDFRAASFFKRRQMKALNLAPWTLPQTRLNSTQLGAAQLSSTRLNWTQTEAKSKHSALW